LFGLSVLLSVSVCVCLSVCVLFVSTGTLPEIKTDDDDDNDNSYYYYYGTIIITIKCREFNKAIERKKYVYLRPAKRSVRILIMRHY